MKQLFVIFLCASLASCGWLTRHRMHVQQGNIVRPDRVAQLHKGMSKGEVASVIGSPVYDNALDFNRWTYVYTKQYGNTPMEHSKLELVFRDDRLVQIIR